MYKMYSCSFIFINLPYDRAQAFLYTCQPLRRHIYKFSSFAHRQKPQQHRKVCANTKNTQLIKCLLYTASMGSMCMYQYDTLIQSYHEQFWYNFHAFRLEQVLYRHATWCNLQEHGQICAGLNVHLYKNATPRAGSRGCGISINAIWKVGTCRVVSSYAHVIWVDHCRTSIRLITTAIELRYYLRRGG